MTTFFIFGAKYLYIFSIILGAIWFWKTEKLYKKNIFIFSLASLFLSFLFGKIANYFIHNPRPFVVNNFTPLIKHVADNGFPSDHTLLAASIASIVTFYNRKLGIMLWVIAIIVGYSRVYTGVHHFLDVAGSIIIALFSSTVSYGLLKIRRVI